VRVYDRYVIVQASIHGSGASGGALNPWSSRTRQDGYEIIEDWIAQQPWSNGKVGIQGFSGPGLVGFLTATTQPPSLKAVYVGGLIDDFFFVLVADQAPDGKLVGLQRGLLRASHRAFEQERSEFVESAGQRLLIRPYRPHDRVEPVPPHEPVEYQIEIFAVGHVFRPGHQLALIICRPPEDDPIGRYSVNSNKPRPRGFPRKSHLFRGGSGTLRRRSERVTYPNFL